jgi:pimeloyl-ACP methyl ester carboxylesterase
VTGALDPKFVHLNQLMMDRCPLAQLTVIPHCGHCIHHEAPNAFVDALEISLHRSSVAS